jgi:lambda repressor-like predicted transcriptional regulator
MTTSRVPDVCTPVANSFRNGGTSNAGRGWQAAVAKALGIDRQKVCDVLAGRRTSQRVAKAISEATGIPVSQMWPGRYKRLEFVEKVNRQADAQEPQHTAHREQP